MSYSFVQNHVPYKTKQPSQTSIHLTFYILYLIYGAQCQLCENNYAYENGHMLLLDIALIWIISFFAC